MLKAAQEKESRNAGPWEIVNLRKLLVGVVLPLLSDSAFWELEEILLDAKLYLALS